MAKGIYKTLAAAAKAYAPTKGVRGCAGGWLVNEQGRAFVQGWAAYGDMLRKRGVIVGEYGAYTLDMGADDRRWAATAARLGLPHAGR